MFRSATLLHFLDLWVDWCADEVFIHIEWAGDLTHARVINLLTDPNYGLPVHLARELECLCDICLYGRYSIKLTDHSGTVRLNLRRSTLYEPVDPPFDCTTLGTGHTQERRARWSSCPSCGPRTTRCST